MNGTHRQVITAATIALIAAGGVGTGIFVAVIAWVGWHTWMARRHR